MRQLFFDIKNVREDITDYVYHFTKGNNAFETLQMILEDGYLRDMHKREKEDYRICFTEAPLKVQPEMFRILSKEDSPLYAPYGIGIKKELLYFWGARPVIYGKNEEQILLPDELEWRFVSYVPNKYDYSWLREWRLPQKEFQVTPQNCIVIVKNKEECEMLFEQSDFIMDGDVDDGEFHCLPLLESRRRFRGVSLEEVEELKGKREIETMINKQHLEEKEYVSLGYL